MNTSQFFTKAIVLAVLSTGLLPFSATAGERPTFRASAEAPFELRGGADSGGGDSVDSPNGGRDLLDFAERDSSFTPFIFRARDYEKNFGKIVDMFGKYQNSLDGNMEMGYRWSTMMDQIPDSIRQPLHECLKEKGGLRWSFTDLALEDLRDEGVIYLTNTESKRQVAIQSDNHVVVNRPEFLQMNDVSKAGLKLHEGLLCAAKRFNPSLHQQSGTEVIRRAVRATANYYFYPDTTPAYVFIEAMQQMLPKRR